MKKGQTEIRFIVAMIVALIGLFIIFLIVKDWSENTNEVIDEKKCWNQVQSHIEMIKLTNGERIMPIECSTVYETLPQTNELAIKNAIAQKMASCWYDWHEGKEELFGEEKFTYCHPCFVLDFEEKDLKITDFDKFLISTYVPGTKDTYMEYFSGQTNNIDFSKEKLLENPDIQQNSFNFNTNSKQVILLYYTKDRNKIKEMVDEVVDTLSYAAVGGGAGAILLGGTGALICAPLPVIGTVTCAKIGATIGGLVGSSIGGFIGSMTSDRYPLWMSFILLKEYNADELKNLGCDIAPAVQH